MHLFLLFRGCRCHGRWRVAKRPGLDAFLKEMAQLYEVVIFTDSMGGLADEVRESDKGRGVGAAARETEAETERGGKRERCIERTPNALTMGPFGVSPAPLRCDVFLTTTTVDHSDGSARNDQPKGVP